MRRERRKHRPVERAPATGSREESLSSYSIKQSGCEHNRSNNGIFATSGMRNDFFRGYEDIPLKGNSGLNRVFVGYDLSSVLAKREIGFERK